MRNLFNAETRMDHFPDDILAETVLICGIGNKSVDRHELQLVQGIFIADDRWRPIKQGGLDHKPAEQNRPILP